tara:strand:- start:553 stop:1125 length:573 start_codon:yes stop_codon:yes gene_type:complete
MNAFLRIILLFSLAACSSVLERRNTVEEVDTKMESEQEISGGDKIGLKDNKLRVQRKVRLAEELRLLENDVYAMENEVYGNRKYGTKGLYGVYLDCTAEKNSVELGGSGKLQPVEPPARVIREERELKYVKDENGDLVGITEEYLSERMDRFKKYRDILEKRRTEYETKLRICKNDVKNAKARVKKQAED